jgi:hypothetical protein
MEFDIREGRAFLARTPATLRALLSGWSDAWLDADEGPDTYSVRDVLGHLIHGEDTDWIPRAEIILRHGESMPFPPFDREGFRAFGTMSLGELLDTFAAKRAGTLARLDGFRLAPADLERTGAHPEFGRVTLGQHLATWVVHDLTHLTQIVRVAAKQYGEAVGPWRAYLGVLRRG